MTISESDRLHSQLSRFEDMFPGYRTEIVEGNIMMSPVKPYRQETIWEIRDALKPQLSRDWAFISDVVVPFDGDNEYCPDMAVIPKAEQAKNLSAYPPELIRLAMEVVSPSSVRHDYEVKDEAYARRGIPHYVIFDPYRGQCRVHWNPGPEGYRGRDTVPYGKTVTIDGELGRLVVDTTDFPIDPNARRS
ncbi:Uma2 family endonuclease [Streptomyces sp. NPDC047097]|uniref:Uma2 family endonuclease n=1 Tax=Streptomyces sp. NPDC047097 TaxID=3155260 RepID=UPI0033EEF9D0